MRSLSHVLPPFASKSEPGQAPAKFPTDGETLAIGHQTPEGHFLPLGAQTQAVATEADVLQFDLDPVAVEFEMLVAIQRMAVENQAVVGQGQAFEIAGMALDIDESD